MLGSEVTSINGGEMLGPSWVAGFSSKNSYFLKKVIKKLYYRYRSVLSVWFPSASFDHILWFAFL